MRENIHTLPPSIASRLDWIGPKMASLRSRASNFLKGIAGKRKLSRRRFREFVPVVAIIAGAVACGLWLNSSAAGLLAAVLLFLLAGAARSLERISARLGSQPIVAPSAGRGASSAGLSSEQNIYVSTKAMERLRSWVEDESSLTEESAKAYCSVLLDTLAMLHPRLAGRAPVESIWS